jgi:hypothetical protein
MMKVQKTIIRNIVTLKHGHFSTHERVLVCPKGCKYPKGALITARAEMVNNLVPIGSNYGYDIEVFVGMERFICHRQRKEIQSALKSEYGISVSTGEISKLSKRFLSHIELLHKERSEDMKQVFSKDGGYPLHIDATTEDGKGTLLVIYAGWRKWVLGAWKIPSENADVIEPKITGVSRTYGEPCAIVRDLGRSIASAVEAAADKMQKRPQILACHFHFLRDIGKDILGEDHENLRKLIRKLAIRENLRLIINKLKKKIGSDDISNSYKKFEKDFDPIKNPLLPDGSYGISIVQAMARWILDYYHDGKNLGFPFDRPYIDFYRRCQIVNKSIEIFSSQTRYDWNVDKALEYVAKAIHPILSSSAVNKTIRKLEQKTDYFDKLRKVFGLEGQKLPEDIDPNCINSIKEYESNIMNEVNDFIKKIEMKYAASSTKADEKKTIKIILDHLKRHDDYLWGHIVKLPEEAGGGIRFVARTNNMLESHFHTVKQHERRRSGRKILTQDFENMPPAAMLTMNLLKPDYVQLLCGSIDNLPLCFSNIDMKQRENLMNIIHSELDSISLSDSQTEQLSMTDKLFVRKDIVRDWIIAASEDKSILAFREEKARLSTSMGNSIFPRISENCGM